MGSMFDSIVYKKRQRNPMMSVNIMDFMKTMSRNSQRLNNEVEEHYPDISLTICNRPSVSSGYWYTLTWIDEDGCRYIMQSQDMTLLGFRALVSHENVLKNILRASKGSDSESIGFIYPDAPRCDKCHTEMYKNKKEETWCSNIYCPY